jgi:hypothetical protein
MAEDGLAEHLCAMGEFANGVWEILRTAFNHIHEQEAHHAAVLGGTLGQRQEVLEILV